ncbi:MAG TPA: hypothetical protein VFK16_03565 [Gemmatimonadaceae bacterium]|jgi:hypothetical protein|nr:hypothetical protein [Gemmatimonadaceae bacterium]
MNENSGSLVMRNGVFGWLALATGVLLLVPLVAMQFTSAVNWNLADFIVGGLLIFGFGSAFVLAARRLQRRYWLATGAVVVLVFLYVWAELAVGVFTHLGS